MSKEVRKRLEKIYVKIDSIAKKGKDNVFEYYKYVDELVGKGQYSDFEQTLFYHYKIDIVDTIDISVVKKNTWKPILFQTNSSFSSKLKKMYDVKNVYQISNNIYTTGTSSMSVLLGQINEIDIYPEDAKYLIENKNYAKLMDSRKIYLEVYKVGSLTASMVTTDDQSLSYDQNLLNRYTISIDYLLI